MGGINMGRVLLGGLLAGLVINIGEYVLNELLLAEQWAVVSEALNLPPHEGSTIVWFIIWGFVIGIAMIWLYAAIRPRCGAGAKTTMCAGLCVWFFTWVMGFGSMAIVGIFPLGFVLKTLIWGIIEIHSPLWWVPGFIRIAAHFLF